MSSFTCIFTHPRNNYWAATTCKELCQVLRIRWCTEQTRTLLSRAYILVQWFSNLSGHQHPLEGLLKHRYRAHHQSFWSRAGTVIYISNKFLSEADAFGPSENHCPSENNITRNSSSGMMRLIRQRRFSSILLMVCPALYTVLRPQAHIPDLPAPSWFGTGSKH